MSDFNIEITESQVYNLEIATSFIENANNIETQIVDVNTIEIVNTEKILPSDFPDTYPINWTIGDLPYTRVSGLTEVIQDTLGVSISGISGINATYNDNSGILTLSLFNPTIEVSDITDFDAGVSGLLPVKNIVGGSNITIQNISGTYSVAVTGQLGLTGEEVDDRVSSLLVPSGYVQLNYNDLSNQLVISITGLQPSGNYSLVGHTHSSANITDFGSAVSGLLPVPSVTNIVASTGISISKTGSEFTVAVASTGFALSNHQHLYTDIINFSSGVESNLSTLLAGGYGIQLNYDNAYDTLRIESTGLQPSGNYALLSSPIFTGTPTVPTASSGTNTNQIASTAFVRTEISNLVSSAPTTLDTLNELASALGNDPNFATTITNNLATKVNRSGDTMTGNLTVPSGYFTYLNINNNTVGGSSALAVNGSITTQGQGVNASAFSIYGSTLNSLALAGSNLRLSTNDITTNHTFVHFSGSTPVERMRITGSGVGINTTTPSGSLDIAGDVYVRGTGNNLGTIYIKSTSSTDTALRLRADTNGNLLLDAGNASVRVGNQDGRAEIKSGPAWVDIGQSYLSVSNQANQHIRFTPANTERVRITNAGYVGIGITSPSGQLHVIGSGIFTSGLFINSTPVSVNGHTHTASNIVDFDTSVSGLLPAISGSQYISANFNNNIYSLQISGLQPSGNYASAAHEHSVLDIINFASGVNDLIDSVVSTSIVGGSGIDIVYSSGNNTLVISALIDGGTP